MSLAYVDEFPDYMGDAKRWRESQMEREDAWRGFEGSNLEVDCPECGWHVWAHIVDGPDPAFVELVCPRDECEHEFSERVA